MLARFLVPGALRNFADWRALVDAGSGWRRDMKFCHVLELRNAVIVAKEKAGESESRAPAGGFASPLRKSRASFYIFYYLPRCIVAEC